MPYHHPERSLLLAVFHSVQHMHRIQEIRQAQVRITLRGHDGGVAQLLFYNKMTHAQLYEAACAGVKFCKEMNKQQPNENPSPAPRTNEHSPTHAAWLVQNSHSYFVKLSAGTNRCPEVRLVTDPIGLQR